MFETLRQSLKIGVITSSYPQTPPEISSQARGKPEIDWAKWKDARPAAAICPTGAISYKDENGQRTARLDLAECIFCGLCAEVDTAIQMTKSCELATTKRAQLATSATFKLRPDGAHESLLGKGADERSSASRPPGQTSVGMLGTELQKQIKRVLGRSLHIREVDAGSCNGCEMEIVGLNSPVYDIERFGIHFVPSPRHADMPLVTGP